MSAEMKGNFVVETSKKIDKVGLIGGAAAYVFWGIPVALVVAVTSGVTLGGTVLVESVYKKWKNKRNK